jgi:hypothetical protein
MGNKAESEEEDLLPERYSMCAPSVNLWRNGAKNT